jgi:Holliday junction resolvase RusA-like endonuclease
MIQFRLPIIPIAKGRPRFRAMGRFVKVYTPAETRKYEAEIARLSRPFAPEAPLAGPLEISLVFSMPRPKHIPKDRLGHPSAKPDLDNLEKAVMDALNGIFWVDDALVVAKGARKVYAGEQGPGIWIAIKPASIFPV